MSQAERNVELAREALAAFSSGDFDALLATMHPDVEWHVFIPLPELTQSVYRGRDEVRMIWTRITARITDDLLEYIRGFEDESSARRDAGLHVD